MKMLVTGGAGFIGTNFIRYWLNAYSDGEVVNLDALTYAGNKENLSGVENDSRYTFYHGDIRNPEDVAKAMKGVDVVVHFAAETHVDRSIDDSSPFLTTNVIGTQILLDRALQENVDRFHHISTDEVYGALALDSDEKFNEETPYDPRSPYSAAKASSDHLVRAYYHTHGLPITISNCSNNYGAYQNEEKLIPKAITNLLNGKKVPVYGDGLNVRDWLYVEDHCTAIDRILQDGKVGETYCIGGMKKDINNLELVKMLLDIMDKGEEMIEFVDDRPGHDRRYAVDWSKINKELGWEPSMDLEEGLRKTVQWYTENHS